MNIIDALGWTAGIFVGMCLLMGVFELVEWLFKKFRIWED